MLTLIVWVGKTMAQDQVLVGQWNIDFQEMQVNSNYTSGFNYDELPSESKAHLKEAFESRSFTFNADQTIRVSFSVRGNSKQVSGTWNYIASNHLLGIEINGETVEYRTSLQGNNLTLEPLIQQPNAVFKSLFLTKN